VCVGMGSIGAEVAASLRTIGCDVTVVEIFETTLYRILGPEIGRVLERIHRDHGVRMLFSDTVERFEGDGRLERVVTEGGVVLDADVAVIGVGTEPAVEIMAGTGLDRGGGIPVGPGLGTYVPGVFAAGDVALHDHPAFGPIRVEHYDNAIKMGEHAAHAMLGSQAVFDDPHWFWSDQYDSKIEMAGFAPTWDRMVVRGSLEERSFCAFLLDDGGVVRSTVSLDWKRDVRRSFGLIGARVAPAPPALADPDVDLRTLVPKEEA
jgi:3-phenylpropionate/trans-cinnamate dioxygenase ferredoxin reductase component